MLKARLAVALVALGGASLFLGACSGKPENSPAIRKKFAEYDQMKQNHEQVVADLQVMTEEVRRLSQENSEIRTLLPSVDGQSAVNKLASLESRLNKIEGIAATGVIGTAQATTSRTTTASATSNDFAMGPPAGPANLESAPLAGSTGARAAAAPVAAAQQEARSSSAADFKQMTAPKRAETAKPEPKKAEIKEAASAPAAPAARPAASRPAATRGTYHTIQAGETIQTIATRYNTTPEKLLSANGLPAGIRLAKGQRLFVPGN